MTSSEVAEWLGIAALVPIVIGLWAFVIACLYVVYQETKK